mmetsp:Transcript_30991/g.84795  ORF Transcript_30991/g.84795 Transcript_30991/m.84795 type:complete len:221 (-) Transcript_30991:481-1143(-)
MIGALSSSSSFSSGDLLRICKDSEDLRVLQVATRSITNVAALAVAFEALVTTPGPRGSWMTRTPLRILSSRSGCSKLIRSIFCGRYECISPLSWRTHTSLLLPEALSTEPRRNFFNVRPPPTLPSSIITASGGGGRASVSILKIDLRMPKQAAKARGVPPKLRCGRLPKKMPVAWPSSNFNINSSLSRSAAMSSSRHTQSSRRFTISTCKTFSPENTGSP